MAAISDNRKKILTRGGFKAEQQNHLSFSFFCCCCCWKMKTFQMFYWNDFFRPFCRLMLLFYFFFFFFFLWCWLLKEEDKEEENENRFVILCRLTKTNTHEIVSGLIVLFSTEMLYIFAWLKTTNVVRPRILLMLLLLLLLLLLYFGYHILEYGLGLLLSYCFLSVVV